jgi:CheY-like chemotaxis protein
VGLDVLVIEDDPSVGDYIRLTLENIGVAVRVAQNGLEGLQLLQQKRPAVVLTDLMMPAMDGWTFLAAIRSTTGLASLPVVTMSATAHAPPPPGSVAFLRKPFTKSGLIEVLMPFLSAVSGSWQSISDLNMDGRLATHVLVVDDDDAIRDVIADVLQDHRFATVMARDGIEALELIQRRDPPIDLVILDLMMPRYDGWDLLQRLREDPEFRHIPVVVVSALTKAGSQLQAGAFLPKPLELNSLVETVDRLAPRAR